MRKGIVEVKIIVQLFLNHFGFIVGSNDQTDGWSFTAISLQHWARVKQAAQRQEHWKPNVRV